MSALFKHQPPYSISGMAGNSLGAGRYPLEVIGAEAGTLRWASMEADTLSWVQRDGIVPDLGQEAHIFDSTGARILSGWVTQRKPKWTPAGTIWTMQISNVWWFLDKIQLSGEAVSADGTTQERPSYIFPKQILELSITSLLSRAIAQGFPFKIGTISSCFEFVRQTYNNQTFARTLLDMISIIPDAMIRWDYDTAGLPEISIIRRNDAPITVLELGSDPDDTRSIDLVPRLELRATSMELQSVALDATGKLVMGKDKAVAAVATDDPLPLPAGGVYGLLTQQMVALSGPGRAGWQEPTIDKVALSTVSGSIVPVFLAKHQGLANVQYTVAVNGWGVGYGLQINPANLVSASGNGYTVTTVQPKTGYFIADATTPGGTLNGYAVTSGEIPAWWAETGYNTQKVRYFARFVADCAATDGQAIALLSSIATFQLKANSGNTLFFFADLEIEYDDINMPGGMVVRPRDLDWVTPPVGLAANLLATQSWLPHEGQVVLGEYSPKIPRPGSVLSATGAPTEKTWPTARALVQATSVDLRTGLTTVAVGAPAFASPSSLVQRYQRSASGQAVEIKYAK